MSKSINEKIEAAKAEIAQKEAHIKQLLQQQKAQERKDRNHRLCKRGGLVEKLLPDLVKLTDEQFDTFVQKTLMSGFAEKVLRGLVPPSQPEDKTEPAQSAAASSGTDASRTGVTARVAG